MANTASEIRYTETDIDELLKLQEILLYPSPRVEITSKMYYRSNAVIGEGEDDSILFREKGEFDFFTYFNALSVAKWKKFTYANKLFLVLDIKGDFELTLYGYKVENKEFSKEILGKNTYKIKSRQRLIIPYPNKFKSKLIAFEIKCLSDIYLYKAYYASDIDKKFVSKPYIAMVTTTYMKEFYIRNNIKLLTDNLLEDKDYKDRFCWNIIDNGRTLKIKEKLHKDIKIFYNKNVGGAGGFARGMMESLHAKKKPTHILLMDDDVVFLPESFKRLYTVLSILKKEYKNHFISGAMLKMGLPNIQHEDTGRLIKKGYHTAMKPQYDLNYWDHILKNEIYKGKAGHEYGAWWFCCIPTEIARLDNLPMPLFFRGDDVEYSLRNKAKFITLNGICIWHEGFEGKFSASLEFYQVNRNELVVTAMHPELSDVDVIGHIKMLFWEEMYKFNYKGASLLLDAVEDYLKGPEHFEAIDGEKMMKEKKEIDNHPARITPDIRKRIDYNKLYQYEELTGPIKKIYDYSYNGQSRIPQYFLKKKKTGVIPYGFGYIPAHQCLTTENIAVDQMSDKYVLYKKSIKKFNVLKTRFEKLMSEYDKNNEYVKKSYRDALKRWKSEEFWKEYLK